MSNESGIRHGRRCVFQLHVHLIFVTKYRRRVFDARAIEVLRDIFADVCSDAQGQQRPDIRKRYWKGVLWSPSYFASSCGGAPISIVRQYIEQQKTPD